LPHQINALKAWERLEQSLQTESWLMLAILCPQAFKAVMKVVNPFTVFITALKKPHNSSVSAVTMLFVVISLVLGMFKGFKNFENRIQKRRDCK
jgi:hypothetical protein